MTPLIDGDIINYEIGFGSQDVIGGVVVPRSWEACETLLIDKINHICDMANATLAPKIYLTNSGYVSKLLNKKRKFEGKPQKEYIENFRNNIAKEKVYKAGRKQEKPFHYKNIINYMLAKYDVVVNENGLEADDAICIEQYSRLHLKDTIICSRDKDLRQCPGWFFSWEHGKQPSIGPIYVEPLGFLEKKEDGKIWGVGHKFFYYQLIVGDTVDNIGGIKGKGPAFAFKLLHDLGTERQCYEHVAELYIKAHGDDWKEKLLEQARLLHMVRELNEDGSPKMWLPPKKDKE